MALTSPELGLRLKNTLAVPAPALVIRTFGTPIRPAVAGPPNRPDLLAKGTAYFCRIRQRAIGAANNALGHDPVDPDALAAGVTPETRSNLVARAFIDHGSLAGWIATQTYSIADSLNPVSGFYVVGHDLAPRIPRLNPDLHIFNVYFEKEGATRGFALKKIGDEWTFDGIYVTGGHDSEP